MEWGGLVILEKVSKLIKKSIVYDLNKIFISCGKCCHTRGTIIFKEFEKYSEIVDLPVCKSITSRILLITRQGDLLQSESVYYIHQS